MKREIIIFLCLLSFFLSGSNGCFSYDNVESTKIKSGASFYQECKCETPGKLGIYLKWIDSHGQEIIPSGPGTRANIFTEWLNKDTYSLYISNITKSISGAYKCMTNYNGQQHVLIYNVEAYDSPYFINTEQNQYVVSGKNELISCQARSETDPLITWYKEQEEFIKISDSDKYSITASGLIIKNVTKEDSGIYKCEVSDLETGEGIDRDISVEVITMPQINNLIASPSDEVYEKESLSVECSASGIPHPEYTWKKYTNETHENKTNWQQVGSKLVFAAAEPDDQGVYECTASNSAGNHSANITIQVLVAPTITWFENVTATEGSVTQIACKATGRPIPVINIIFLGDDQQSVIWDSKNISDMETEFRLTFLEVNRTNAGTYICNASNEVYSAVKEMNMSVLHQPYFDDPFENVWGWQGKVTNLSCEHDSNPPAEIIWRYHVNDIPLNNQIKINQKMNENLHKPWILTDNDTLYGVYECIARNMFGEAKKIIHFHEGFIPPPINNVSLLNVTSNSATFSINEPIFVNGPPIIGFTSEYDEIDNYNITDIHMNRTWSIQRPFIIDRLKSNTSYGIKFAAINNVGTGQWSNILEFVTLEKNPLTSPPEEPVWQTTPEEAANERLLRWSSGKEEDKFVDYYMIRRCPILNETIEESLCKVHVESSNEFQLNEMDSNTTYYIEVVAHNALGNSSALHISVTLPAKEEPMLSAGALIGISIVVVFMCLVLLDLVLLLWRRQGIVANCCYKKKHRLQDKSNPRDKKGLLKDGENVKQSSNGHKEYEYNKTTGVITGKHSAV